MCTVTFIARRNGYALGMNRDEQRTRSMALPPGRRCLGRHAALFPSEPGGGTWIGVNDAGVGLALVNWYSVPVRVAGRAVSRGVVVNASLPADSPALVEATLARLPLPQVNPFRLVGVFPSHRGVVEWRWNLASLERLDHGWLSHIWISSGFDESGAQQIRSQAFNKAMRESSSDRVDWLHRFHRSHGPERGPYSTCMHREDANTVSYTEIRVADRGATLRYTPGAPCCTAFLPALCLPRDRLRRAAWLLPGGDPEEI